MERLSDGDSREDLGDDIRVEHLNKLSVKLRTSGYNTQFIRKVLVAGLKNYEKKVKNSKLDVSDKNYAPLHIPRGFKSAQRLEKKLMTKSSWYKKDGNSKETGTDQVREEFPLAPMGVRAPGSVHAGPSAQPPIYTSRNYPAHMSAESPSNISGSEFYFFTRIFIYIS